MTFKNIKHVNYVCIIIYLQSLKNKQHLKFLSLKKYLIFKVYYILRKSYTKIVNSIYKI